MPGKKLLVSSSERVEQTGKRAADEAISCAMKASDVVKGMGALVLEMRDRLKRANKPNAPDHDEENELISGGSSEENAKSKNGENKKDPLGGGLDDDEDDDIDAATGI